MSKIKNVVTLLIEAGNSFASDRSSRLAAALAYYTMFALAPMLIIVTAIVSQILTADTIARFFNQIGVTKELLAGEELLPFIESVIGSDAAGWIRSVIEGVTAPASLTVAALISLILAFWGASNLFHHLKETLNIIWGVRAAPGAGPWVFVRGRLLAFGAVLFLGLLLIAFVLLNTIVAAVVSLTSTALPDSIEVFETWRVVQILQFALGFAVMVVIFALIFKLLPDVKITWKDVWVGSLVTAFLFIIGTIGMAIYFQLTSVGSLYGAAGSIMVVLIWFYYSAQIFLYGAEFTQVFAASYGSKIIPAEHAVVYITEVQEDAAVPDDAIEAGRVDEKRKTILRAPDWFMELTGRIEGLLVRNDKTDSSEQDPAGK